MSDDGRFVWSEFSDQLEETDDTTPPYSESFLPIHTTLKFSWSGEELHFALAETRTPNHYERRIDFAQIERALDSAETQAIAALVPVFEAVRDRLLNYVRRNFEHDHATIRDATIRGTNALRQPFMDFLLGVFERGQSDLGHETPQIKEHAAKPNFSPKDAVRFMKNRTDFFISWVNKDLTQKAKQVLMTALDKGTPINQTVNNLSALFEPYTGNKKVIKDQEQLKPYRLETIVRTNATEAYNRGRLVAAEAAGDLVQGFEWSSVIDQATTEVCQLLDGYVFPDGSDWLTELRPPRHFNCRSILVPITIDQQIDEEDFITDDVAGRALALSGDGFAEEQDARCYCECLDDYHEYEIVKTFPAGFDTCREGGGEIRTISGPDDAYGLGDGEYMHVCFLDGKMHRGEVKTKQKDHSNPNHRPAGDEHGGEFASADGGLSDWVAGSIGDKRSPDQPGFRAFTRVLEEAPTFKGIVFRGLRMTPDQLAGIKVGSEWRLQQHSSSSKGRLAAELFSLSFLDDKHVPVLLQVDSKSGADLSSLLEKETPTEHVAQKEVVLKYGSKYRVLSVQKVPVRQSSLEAAGMGADQAPTEMTLIKLREQ